MTYELPEDEPEVEETEVEDAEELNTLNAPVNEYVALEEPADPDESPFVQGDPHARLDEGLDEPDEGLDEPDEEESEETE